MNAERGALRQAGLTEYQARAYEALLSLGGAGATDIAEAAHIPRTRVYRVLAELEDQGWLVSDDGRPRVYHAREPSSCLEGARQRFEMSLRDALPSLQARFAEREQRFAGSVWILDGMDAVLRRARIMISEARDLVVLGTPVVGSVAKPLGDDLVRAARRGVRVWTAAEPGSPVAGLLGDLGLPVDEARLPIGVLLVDGKQALVLCPVPRGDEVDIRAVWNPNEAIASMMAESVVFSVAAGLGPGPVAGGGPVQR